MSERICERCGQAESAASHRLTNVWDYHRFEAAAPAATGTGDAETAPPCSTPLHKRCADALADEVAVLIHLRMIDARSPAGDALLDYRDPPTTPRADRLASLLSEIEALAAEPWPVVDVLEMLAGAAEHLMRDHDCDAHGWELVSSCVPRARSHAAALRSLLAKHRGTT